MVTADEGNESSDVDALETTREESRVVLDHRISLQKDIDDKALRTVRLSLVLIALVVSVAQLMEPAEIDALETGTILSVSVGVLFLAVAILLGLGVYFETELPFGVADNHRLEVTSQSYSEEEWLELLLNEYSEWIGDARESNEFNSWWLGRAQASMVVGVAYLFVSTIVLFTPITAAVAFLGASLIGGIVLLLYFVIAQTRGDQ